MTGCLCISYVCTHLHLPLVFTMYDNDHETCRLSAYGPPPPGSDPAALLLDTATLHREMQQLWNTTPPWNPTAPYPNPTAGFDPATSLAA